MGASKYCLTSSARGPRFVDVNGRKQAARYESVNAYIERNGLKKKFLIARWGVAPFQMSALVNPNRYRVSPPLNAEQIRNIAADLGWTERDVRQVYESAA